MMNFTKKAGAVAVTTLLLASSANAATFNANASFRTIADVAITEASALSFGTAVTGKAGTSCTVGLTIASGGANAVPGATATVQPTGAGATGCGGTTDALAGNYTLVGSQGATITVLMATATETDFTFAPAGIFTDESNVAVSVETAYFADAAFNVVIGDTGGGRIGVGGQLTITNDLTSSTSYTVPYVVSVIY